MNSKQRIEELTKILTDANYRYYVLDNPTMPDYEYDHLLRELEVLESKHPDMVHADSPTKRVGGEALSQFEKVTHPVPLMSLQDVFSMEELNEFLEKTKEVGEDLSFSVEPKIDGLSVALEYVNGQFIRGATRGDGNVGEVRNRKVSPFLPIPEMQLPDLFVSWTLKLLRNGDSISIFSIFSSLMVYPSIPILKRWNI